jgi:Icc-related predicted phosphoesterase
VRVCCLADLHGRLPPEVPECDLLLLAGDLCPDGIGASERFLVDELAPWLARQPAGEVAAVAGNHDQVAVDRPELLRALPGWRYLEHETELLAGAVVAASPWSLEFGAWPLQTDEEHLALLWDEFPDDARIVLVHGPPFGHCDVTRRGDHGGSRSLLDRLLDLEHLELVCTGHIHEAHGSSQLPTGALVVNASYVDVRFEPANAPVVVDL